MASSINASTSGAGGVITTADNTGTLQLQSGGTTIATVSSTGLAINSGNITVASTAAPAFHTYPNAQQTVSNTTFTLVANQVEDYDVGGCYNNTGSTVTLNGLSVPAYAFCPNVAGYYIFTGAIQWGNTVAGTLVQLYKNGGAYQKRGWYSGSASTSGTNVTAMFYLNGTGDYVQLYTYQASGSSQTTTAGPGDFLYVQYFQGAMIRSA
jgi:hypothetical protein